MRKRLIIKETKEADLETAKLVARYFKQDESVDKTRVCCQWHWKDGVFVFSHYRIRAYSFPVDAPALPTT